MDAAPAPNQIGLLSMSRQELLNLFRSSPAGPIPNGRARGVAIVAPGTQFGKLIAEAIDCVGWQGKTFYAARGALVNSITPFRIDAIAAKVYRASSLLDGKECIVLDYSRTSTLARWIRDEIRNVAPNLYLGIAYCGKTRLIGFSLDFASVKRSTGCKRARD
jgi:hypothetical protein